jgi:PAS domain S-box-containing protein
VRTSGRGKQSSKRLTGNPPKTTRSHDTYRTIFDNVNDAIVPRDPETKRILDVNSKLCEMTGYTAGEIKKMAPGWFSTSPVQNGKTVAGHYAQAACGKPQLFERQGRKKDGTLFWVESNLRKVTIGGREYLLSVLRDITRHRQEQEELMQSQERYRSIVEDQSEFLVCHFLADGTMTFVNEALCRCVGVRKEKLVGRLSGLSSQRKTSKNSEHSWPRLARTILRKGPSSTVLLRGMAAYAFLYGAVRLSSTSKGYPSSRPSAATSPCERRLKRV